MLALVALVFLQGAELAAVELEIAECVLAALAAMAAA